MISHTVHWLTSCVLPQGHKMASCLPPLCHSAVAWHRALLGSKCPWGRGQSTHYQDPQSPLNLWSFHQGAGGYTHHIHLAQEISSLSHCGCVPHLHCCWIYTRVVNPKPILANSILSSGEGFHSWCLSRRQIHSFVHVYFPGLWRIALALRFALPLLDPFLPTFDGLKPKRRLCSKALHVAATLLCWLSKELVVATELRCCCSLSWGTVEGRFFSRSWAAILRTVSTAPSSRFRARWKESLLCQQPCLSLKQCIYVDAKERQRILQSNFALRNPRIQFYCACVESVLGVANLVIDTERSHEIV